MLRHFYRRGGITDLAGSRNATDNIVMSTLELITRELAEMPEPLRREVYEFVRFLRLKSREDQFNGLLLSESALAKDWNTPEEDAAWQSL
jgi:hypothetical protein